jgi:hypothetical protein
MRQAISFSVAVLTFGASAYAIYHLLVVSSGFRLWWVGGAAMLLFISAYWLWEDFGRKLLGREEVDK